MEARVLTHLLTAYRPPPNPNCCDLIPILVFRPSNLDGTYRVGRRVKRTLCNYSGRNSLNLWRRVRPDNVDRVSTTTATIRTKSDVGTARYRRDKSINFRLRAHNSTHLQCHLIRNIAPFLPVITKTSTIPAYRSRPLDPWFHIKCQGLRPRVITRETTATTI